MKKKTLMLILSMICVVSLLTGICSFGIGATTQINLALSESKWENVQNPLEGAITYSATDGITLNKWSSAQTSGVYLKEKLSAKSSVTVKFTAQGDTTDSSNTIFIMQFANRKCTTSVMNYKNSGAAGGRAIILESKSDWNSIKVKDMSQYDQFGNVVSIADGNTGATTPIGGNNFLDNVEHTVVLSTEDTATGILFNASIDGASYVLDKAIDEPALQGGLYFSMGMTPFNDKEITGFSCKYSSVVVEKEMAPENLALSESNFVNVQNPIDGAITYSAVDGVSLNKWSGEKSSAVYYKDPLTATTKIDFDFTAKSAGNVGHFMIQLMTTKATSSILNYKNSGTGRTIIMTMENGWMSCKVKDIAQYDINANVVTIVDGNAGATEPIGGTDVFDGINHNIIIEKTPTATGVKLSIRLDKNYFVKDYALDEPVFQGETFLGMGIVTAAGGETVYGDELHYVKIAKLNLSPKPDVVYTSNIKADEWGTFDSNQANSVNFDRSGGVMQRWSYAKPSGVYYKTALAGTSEFAMDIVGNFDFVEKASDIISDPQFYEVGKNVFSLVLNKTDVLEKANPHYYGSTPASGKYIKIEFVRVNSVSNEVNFNLCDGGTYISKNLDRKYPTTIVDSDKFDIGTNLFDGKLHSIRVNTKEIETGIYLSITVDGKVFTDGNYDDLTMKGNYFVKAFTEHNWVVDRCTAADPSEYVRIVNMTTTGIVIPDVTAPETDYDKAQNLVNNKWNFSLNPTNVKQISEGIKFTNIPSGVGQGLVMTNAKVNQFDYAMKFNANLKTDWDIGKGTTDIGYCTNMFVNFMIDNDSPAYNKTSPQYYRLEFGRNDKAFGDVTDFIAITTLKGYGDSSILKSWKVYTTNLGFCDNADHWLEVKVRNFENSTQKGIIIKVYMDGKLVLSLTDPDCVETETIGNISVTNEKKLFGKKGYIGLSTGSDGTTAETAQSSFLIKESYLKSYDDVAEGAYVAQGVEPEFDITASDSFVPQQAYYVGESIQLNLSTLFINAGNYPLTYTIVKNGTETAIGTLNGNMWSFMPDKEEVIVLRVTAANEEHKKSAYILVDLNIVKNTIDDGGGTKPEPIVPDTGCGTAMAAIFPLMILLGGAMIMKKFY